MTETETSLIAATCAAPLPARRASVLRRIVAFPLVLLIVETVLILAAANAVTIALMQLGVSIETGGPLSFALAVLLSLVMIAVHKLFMRFVERAPDTGFAPAGALRELGLGIALGGGLMSLGVVIVWALGALRFTGIGFPGELWAALGIAVLSGVSEELLFRGVFLRQLEAMLGTWAALGLTSALFGFAHLMNPNATVFSSVAIMLEAGIMLGAAYLLTRRLWLAIGIHASWNFFQGWVFSIPISGTRPLDGLIATSRQGSEWLSGGEFGLEASVVALALATATGLYLLQRARDAAPFLPPMWRRRPAR